MDNNVIVLGEINVLDKKLYDYNNASLSLSLFKQSSDILKGKALRWIEQSPAFTTFLESLKPTELFDVRMSQTAQEMYQKGEWVFKFSETKNGYLPTISDSSGHWVEQVVLDPKSIAPNLSNALTNISMQQQLGELMEQMEMLSNAIQRIERGQRNDRIGLFYSARQQLIEAVSMSNEDLQSLAFINASRTANDARFQLMQTMKSDIDQIINNKQLKKKERDDLSISVRESMQYINESTALCIMCFSALGETKPMLAALRSYQCFIEQELSSANADGLTQSARLHQNWNGTDNEWLNIPEKISRKLQEIIEENTINPALLKMEV